MWSIRICEIKSQPTVCYKGWHLLSWDIDFIPIYYGEFETDNIILSFNNHVKIDNW